MSLLHLHRTTTAFIANTTVQPLTTKHCTTTALQHHNTTTHHQPTVTPLPSLLIPPYNHPPDLHWFVFTTRIVIFTSSSPVCLPPVLHQLFIKITHKTHPFVHLHWFTISSTSPPSSGVHLHHDTSLAPPSHKHRFAKYLELPENISCSLCEHCSVVPSANKVLPGASPYPKLSSFLNMKTLHRSNRRPSVATCLALPVIIKCFMYEHCYVVSIANQVLLLLEFLKKSEQCLPQVGW